MKRYVLIATQPIIGSGVKIDSDETVAVIESPFDLDNLESIIRFQRGMIHVYDANAAAKKSTELANAPQANSQTNPPIDFPDPDELNRLDAESDAAEESNDAQSAESQPPQPVDTKPTEPNELEPFTERVQGILRGVGLNTKADVKAFLAAARNLEDLDGIGAKVADKIKAWANA